MLVKNLVKWILRIFFIILGVVVILSGLAGIIIEIIKHPLQGLIITVISIIVVVLGIYWIILEGES